MNSWDKWCDFGYSIRRARRKRGYRKARDFTAEMEERAGIAISPDTLYKIEEGKQIPRLDVALAILETLDGEAVGTIEGMEVMLNE